MSTLIKMTYAEWVHLCCVKMYSHEGGKYTEMAAIERRWLSSLVRKGLVSSMEQSEQVRGERRAYWRIYKITDAGLKRLAAGPEGVHSLPSRTEQPE